MVQTSVSQHNIRLFFLQSQKSRYFYSQHPEISSVTAALVKTLAGTSSQVVIFVVPLLLNARSFIRLYVLLCWTHWSHASILSVSLVSVLYPRRRQFIYCKLTRLGYYTLGDFFNFNLLNISLCLMRLASQTLYNQT